MLEDNHEGRYRYTVIHECGHDIFHVDYYSYNPDQISFLDKPSEPMVQCRSINPNGNRKLVHMWDEKDTMEWQTNYFASALLMPKSMIIEAVKDNYDFVRSISYENQVRFYTEYINNDPKLI